MPDAQLALTTEVIQALHRGNIALWIGPNSDIQGLTSEAVLKTNWLAVWSDQQSREFANCLERRWVPELEGDMASRFVREVPLKLEDSLGTYFSFVDICPVFYLRGTGPTWQNLSTRAQRRDRDEKTDVLERLDDAILIVDGFKEVSETVEFINDELAIENKRLKALFVNFDLRNLQSVFSGVEDSIKLQRIRFSSLSLNELLEQSHSQPDDTVCSPTVIKVGNKLASIADHLSREEPIDQEFEVLTMDLVAPPRADEDSDELVIDFLRGTGAPWRAIRNRLTWQRNEHRILAIVNAVSYTHLTLPTICSV